MLLMVIVALLTGCKTENNTESKDSSSGMQKVSTDLRYATQFTIDNYENGYKCIHVADGTDYILVPEGMEKDDLGIENPVYLPIKSNNVYLAASSVMDLFMTLDSLDAVAACSTKASDYSVGEISKKIDSGEIVYVGKYSSPDYESLLSMNCDIAIESTMISHAPKIKEQLESLSIPVFVERSSYEESPLGRLEWVKVYGALLGKETEAQLFFDSQVEKLANMEKSLAYSEDSGLKSVAFFYISSNGYVNVRKPGDYICKMLEIAGAEYALSSIMAESNALSTVNINWEEFYSLAKDADILIYNGTIDGGIESTADLISKNALFSDFKAVRAGNVYGTSLNMYQESSKIVDVILEMNNVILKKDLEDNRFILPLDGNAN